MRHLHAKVLLTAAAMSFGFVGGVNAADMPFPVKALMPSCVWCGWYAGVNGGYGWADAIGRIGNFSTADGVNFTPDLLAGALPSFLAAKHQGGFGGGQIGYNWVMSN